jgi:glyoxylase-like metal-dependent hydrolase (beta-lactamase superfamily II)
MTGTFEEVCKGVYLVGGSGLSDGADCLVYALDLGDQVLIDCGAGNSWERIQQNMKAAGMDPGNLHTLLLTHAHVDHIGAAALIEKQTGCRVVAHALDADPIRTGDPEFTVASLYGIQLQGVVIDRVVDCAEETLEFSAGKLKLIHTPGHTPGSLVALLDTDKERVLFGQDIHGPFSPAFGSDLDAWQKSMQRLMDLEADVLCEGHFGIFRPAIKVREFILAQLATPRSMMPIPH